MNYHMIFKYFKDFIEDVGLKRNLLLALETVNPENIHTTYSE